MRVLVQIMFWPAIGGTLYGTYWLSAHGHWAWWMSLVFGTLMTRLIFEALMLRYQTYLCLTEIRDSLRAGRWALYE